MDWVKEEELRDMLEVATSAANTVPRSNFVVREASGSKGKGLFSREAISKGSYLFDYDGNVLKHDRVFDASETVYAISTCNAAGTPFLIDASAPSAGIARYMNHDSDPNIMCVRGAYSRQNNAADTPPPIVHVFARRDIAAEEEMVWNYGDQYWERDGRVLDSSPS